MGGQTTRRALLAAAGGAVATLPTLGSARGQETPADSTDPPAIRWQRTYGAARQNDTSGVITTSDGGFVVVGSQEAGITSEGMWVERRSGDWTRQWRHTYDSSFGDAALAHHVVESADGGYLVTGHTSFNRDSSGHRNGTGHMWKLDADGNTAWATDLEEFHWVLPGVVIQDARGGYVAVGYNRDRTGENQSALLWRVDAAGETDWATKVDRSQDDFGSGLLQVAGGGYLFCGDTAAEGGGAVVGSVGADGSVQDFRVSGGDGSLAASVDPGRRYGWQFRDRSSALSVAPASREGYVFTGQYARSDASDAWVFKIDNEGRIVWDRTYEFNRYDEGIVVNRAPRGGYIIAGQSATFRGLRSGTRGWLLRTDRQGREVWRRSVDVDTYTSFTGLTTAPDGSYVAVGETAIPTDTGLDSVDALAVRVDHTSFVDTPAPTPTPQTATPSRTPTTSTQERTTTGSGPGFGVWSALAGTALAGWVLRKRRQ